VRETLSGFAGSIEVTITEMNYPGEIQSNTSYTTRVWYMFNATPGDYTFT
jgi:hypothetical protein